VLLPTAHFTHILPALVALPAEAMLRKAFIQAAKTSQTAGTLGEMGAKIG
jgi:hypothetical protein